MFMKVAVMTDTDIGRNEILTLHWSPRAFLLVDEYQLWRCRLILINLSNAQIERTHVSRQSKRTDDASH